MYNALKINRGVINGFNFEEQIKLRDIARKMTRARAIDENGKENKKWISCSVYINQTQKC